MGMLDISFTLSGFDEITAAFEELGDLALDVAAEIVETSQDELETLAKENARVDTGDLREKIISMPIYSDRGVVYGNVLSAAPHGAYIEFGTGPKGAQNHSGTDPEAQSRVRYRSTPWLFPRKDGTFRYTHGQPAKPYMYPALVVVKGKLRDWTAQTLKRKLGDKYGR